MPDPNTPQAVSIYDHRPFLEKVLVYGKHHGLLDAAKLESICHEAPKGMVQIARYFGTEYLRPELELARDRLVNLVSLHLEHSTSGDLQQAAGLLRNHSLLSRSKAGADMLKSLITMPQTTHFGMNEAGGFRDEHIPLLAKWSLRSLADYRAELARRTRSAQVIGAAIWLAEQLGVSQEELEAAGKDAEAVIRTALMALALQRTEMPDWPMFEKIILALRKKYRNAPDTFAIALPRNLPADLQSSVAAVRDSLVQDAARWLPSDVSVRKQFDQSPAFIGRYFWKDDTQSEISDYERKVSKAWDKATGGHDDESSLLTLFTSMAAGAPAKTLLTDKGVASLVRKIRKSGLNTALPRTFIKEHAPIQFQDDYLRLWDNFIEDALPTLQNDFDTSSTDAVALLRRECNVKG